MNTPVRHQLELALRVNNKLITIKEEFPSADRRPRVEAVLRIVPRMHKQLMEALERMQEREAGK